MGMELNIPPTRNQDTEVIGYIDGVFLAVQNSTYLAT
jgi:hypothetical protein